MLNETIDKLELVKKIVQSPSYKLAEEDKEFLKSYQTRGIRLELDYLKAELIMSSFGIKHTIVVYGSARLDEHSCYYKDAMELGKLVGKSGNGIEDNRVVIATGGGPGIMEAANRGSYDVGAKSIGFNIQLPHEQFPNPYITPELCFQFYYFAIRKMHFLNRARALVVYPGGFGTLDELFETLTLMQTKKMRKIPVILIDKEYWNSAVNFEFLKSKGVIADKDLDIFNYVNCAKEAWNMILLWHKNNKTQLFKE